MAPGRGAVRRVLGVDPGLATTGWGVVEKAGSAFALKGFGAILSSPRLELPQRLKGLRDELLSVIQTYQPEVLAVEQLFFTRFASSIASTAQARGVILMTAAECRLPVVEYNPRLVKMALTGFGSAEKRQMQAMVQRLFGLKEWPQPDDAADALAIALCHLQTNPELLPRVRESENARVRQGMGTSPFTPSRNRVLSNSRTL